MKKLRKHSTLIVIAMLTIGISIESFSVSNTNMIGQYNQNSVASKYHNKAQDEVQMGVFPALLLVAAEALGAAYAAGYVAGRLAYAAFGEASLTVTQDRNYDNLAFAQFDNS